MAELWSETPCEHGRLESHSWGGAPADPDWNEFPEYTNQCPGGSRTRITIDYGDMDDVSRERIQEALDSYDLRLTEHWQIRVLAHAANRFLVVAAVLGVGDEI